MRYFIDTEFFEDGTTIELISIGIVAEDGREYYACNTDFSWARYERWQRETGDDWLKRNVFPHLPKWGAAAWKLRGEIHRDLAAFLEADPKPEFWAYCADYDWVV